MNYTMKPETRVISAAMYDLAESIQSDDGVANAACAQAAERLDAQTVRIKQLEMALQEIAEWTDRWTSGDHPVGNVARRALNT